MTDRLKEIKARRAAITAGAWNADLDVFSHEEPEIEACLHDEKINVLFTAGTDCILPLANQSVPWTEEQQQAASGLWKKASESQALKDAEFFANCPDDIDWLVSEVERLRAELKKAGK